MTEMAWLNPRQLGSLYQKDATTIRLWCSTGFCIELGLVVRKDATGHWLVGIPSSHSLFDKALRDCFLVQR